MVCRVVGSNDEPNFTPRTLGWMKRHSWRFGVLFSPGPTSQTLKNGIKGSHIFRGCLQPKLGWRCRSPRDQASTVSPTTLTRHTPKKRSPVSPEVILGGFLFLRPDSNREPGVPLAATCSEGYPPWLRCVGIWGGGGRDRVRFNPRSRTTSTSASAL